MNYTDYLDDKNMSYAEYLSKQLMEDTLIALRILRYTRMSKINNIFDE